MRHRTKSGAVFVAAAAIGCGCAWADDAAASITVEVRDDAHLSAATLAAATSLAGRTLGKAGIEVRWTSPQTAGAPGASSEIGDPTRLELAILAPGQPAPVLTHSALGYAVLRTDGTPGTRAGVRMGEVQRALHDTVASLPQVLGYVIAHELGHLLLGMEGHTQWGLMAADVVGRRLDQAARGTLAFSSDEAERLRAGVRRRRAAASAPPAVVD